MERGKGDFEGIGWNKEGGWGAQKMSIGLKTFGCNGPREQSRHM